MSSANKKLEKEANAIFDLYDTADETKNTVEGKYYAEMLRAVGLAPDDQEESRTHPVTKEEFLARVIPPESNAGPHPSHYELAGAFKMFDTALSGNIGSNNMRNILCNLGDRMPAEEVEIVVQKLKDFGAIGPNGDAEMNIDEFVDRLLNEKF